MFEIEIYGVVDENIRVFGLICISIESKVDDLDLSSQTIDKITLT